MEVPVTGLWYTWVKNQGMDPTAFFLGWEENTKVSYQAPSGTAIEGAKGWSQLSDEERVLAVEKNIEQHDSTQWIPMAKMGLKNREKRMKGKAAGVSDEIPGSVKFRKMQDGSTIMYAEPSKIMSAAQVEEEALLREAQTTGIRSQLKAVKRAERMQKIEPFVEGAKFATKDLLEGTIQGSVKGGAIKAGGLRQAGEAFTAAGVYSGGGPGTGRSAGHPLRPAPQSKFKSPSLEGMITDLGSSKAARATAPRHSKASRSLVEGSTRAGEALIARAPVGDIVVPKKSMPAASALTTSVGSNPAARKMDPKGGRIARTLDVNLSPLTGAYQSTKLDVRPRFKRNTYNSALAKLRRSMRI